MPRCPMESVKWRCAAGFTTVSFTPLAGLFIYPPMSNPRPPREAPGSGEAKPSFPFLSSMPVIIHRAHDFGSAFFHRFEGGKALHFRVLRRFVRVRYAREVRKLARARLFVHAFDVPLFAGFKRCVYVHFDETG